MLLFVGTVFPPSLALASSWCGAARRETRQLTRGVALRDGGEAAVSGGDELPCMGAWLLIPQTYKTKENKQFSSNEPATSRPKTFSQKMANDAKSETKLEVEMVRSLLIYRLACCHRLRLRDS